MGGIGSGYHRGRRSTVEETCALDVLALHRDGVLSPGYVGWRRWTWQDFGEEHEASIGLEAIRFDDGVGLRIFYRHIPRSGTPEDLAYVVRTNRTPCTFGGSRPWFRCPNVSCGRRCRFLHSYGKFYVCRVCANLTYRTRQIHRDGAAECGCIGRRLDALASRLSRARSDRTRNRLERRIVALHARENALLDAVLDRARKGGASA